MLLLKRQNLITSNVDALELSENEKKIVNDFLNWDNPIKNEVVYNIISYCIDYCMLTIRKDDSSFTSLFRGKVFYLDANVIFRLAGINNEERKIVTSAFINKCLENGIKIKYTNHTYQEVTSTITNQVDNLAAKLKGHRLVSTSHYEKFSHPHINIDFLKLYEKWSNESGKPYKNYEEFEKFLIKKVDLILSKFKRVDFIGYETTKKEDFEALCENLKEYKSTKGAPWTESSISIDVNNYLHVFYLRRKRNGINFFDISDYLISTDGNLCEWGKEILPGTIPVALLPSVWHSLLLKFKGRTSEDYKAFTLFLNQRYRINPFESNSRKHQILSLVQDMDEPVDLKNLILDEIHNNLLSKYKEIPSAPDIIEKAKNEVIEKEIRKISQNADALIEEGKAKGKLEAYYDIAENNTSHIIARRKSIHKIIDYVKLFLGFSIILIILMIILVYGVGFFIKTLQTDICGYNIGSLTTILIMISQVIVYLVLEPIKKNYLHLDYDKIKKQEYDKLNKRSLGSNFQS